MIQKLNVGRTEMLNEKRCVINDIFDILIPLSFHYTIPSITITLNILAHVQKLHRLPDNILTGEFIQLYNHSHLKHRKTKETIFILWRTFRAENTISTTVHAVTRVRQHVSVEYLSHAIYLITVVNATNRFANVAAPIGEQIGAD